MGAGSAQARAAKALAAKAELEAATRVELRRLAGLELAGTQFAYFVRYLWPVLHPTVPLVWGPHLDVMCNAIDQQLRGNPDYRNLLMLIPPGFNKSIITSVMRPAWVWLHWASRSSVYVSNIDSLAERDSVRTRQLLQSPQYKELQAHMGAEPTKEVPQGRRNCPVCGLRAHPIWTFANDNNTKINFENSRRGVRQCISITSTATGKRGDDIIFDDILDAKEVREATATRLKEILDQADDQAGYFESTRVNDLRTATRTLIMQPLCEGDPAHRRIAEGGWKVICLPIRFDPEHPNRCVEDWRTVAGQWLHPERFTEEEESFVRQRLKEHYEPQYEMRWRSKDGGIVRQPWVERYYIQEPNAIKALADEVVISIDSAVKGKESNDPVSMMCVARVGIQKHVIDLVNERMGWLELKRRSRMFIRAHPEAKVKIIEDKASGSQLAEELKADDPANGWAAATGIVLFDPGKDNKMVRFKRWAVPDLEAGDLLLPPPERCPWVSGLQRRLVGLKENGTDDDDADTLAMILRRWQSGEAAVAVTRLLGRPRLESGAVTRWQGRDPGCRYRMGVCAGYAISGATATWAVVLDHDTGVEVARVVVSEGGEGAAICAVSEEAAYWGATLRVGSMLPGGALRFAKEMAKRRVRVVGRDQKVLTDGEKAVWTHRDIPKLWGELDRVARDQRVVVRSAELENEVAAGVRGEPMSSAVTALSLAAMGGKESMPKPAGGPKLVLLAGPKRSGDAWSQTAIAGRN